MKYVLRNRVADNPRGYHYNNGEADAPINYGPYIDYSTSPQYKDRFAPFIISDVSFTLGSFFGYRRMFSFYKLFPLHEIIETLLSTNYESTAPNYDEYIMLVTEEKLGDAMCSVDFDELSLFYETLLRSLDEEIGRTIPSFTANLNYVFYKWIDPVSVCLCDNSELQNIILPDQFTQKEQRLLKRSSVRSLR